MKKLIKIIVILSLLLLTACGRVTEQQARQALHNNLVKRYGQEFEIGYMGRRSDGKETWYQAEIYPSKYKGTPKEYDKYYRSSGSVDIKKGIFGESIEYVGDLYRLVLINESANEFYLLKLKELFGENVLPVLEIDISELEIVPNFIDDYKEGLEKNQRPKIKGGVYIFGRVENDEDREWYRKQIYEFVQFMKQTGTFEYVSLGIIVIDERVLSKEFQENEDLKAKLVENGKKYWKKDRRYYNEVIRRELMNKELSKNVTPIINLEDINKSSMINSLAWSNYNNLLTVSLYSAKYIESQLLDREKKEYNNINDLKFVDEEKRR